MSSEITVDVLLLVGGSRFRADSIEDAVTTYLQLRDDYEAEHGAGAERFPVGKIRAGSTVRRVEYNGRLT